MVVVKDVRLDVNLVVCSVDMLDEIMAEKLDAKKAELLVDLKVAMMAVMMVKMLGKISI